MCPWTGCHDRACEVINRHSPPRQGRAERQRGAVMTAETVFLDLSGSVVPRPARPARWRRVVEAAFYPLFGLYSAFALFWLVVGLAFGAIADIPALHQAVDQWQASVGPHGFTGHLADAVRVGVDHSET